MRTKKLLAVTIAAVMMLSATAVSAENAQSAATVQATTANECYRETRTITFASEGGSYVAPITEKYGTLRCIKDFVPVKDGYMFQGWYVNPQDKSQRVTEYTFNEDITLYAGWMSTATYITQPKTVGVDLIYLTDEQLAERTEEIKARQEPVTQIKQESSAPSEFSQADWNKFFAMLQLFMQQYAK